MMHLMRLFLIIVVTVFTLASGAHAQSQTEGSRFDVQKLAIVDLSFVLRNATATGKIRELLDEKKDEFSREFQQREALLLQREKEINAIRATTSSQEFNAAVQAFQNDVAEVQKEIQFKRNSLDQAFQQAQDNLRDLALEIVTAIAQNEQLDMVVTRESALIFRQDLNITQDVLDILNERTKNARIEVGELPF